MFDYTPYYRMAYREGPSSPHTIGPDYASETMPIEKQYTPSKQGIKARLENIQIERVKKIVVAR